MEPEREQRTGGVLPRWCEPTMKGGRLGRSTMSAGTTDEDEVEEEEQVASCLPEVQFGACSLVDAVWLPVAAAPRAPMMSAGGRGGRRVQ